MGQRILQGLNVSVIGMTITISSLIALTLIIILLSRIISMTQKSSAVSGAGGQDGATAAIVPIASQAPAISQDVGGGLSGNADVATEGDLIAIFAAVVAYAEGAAPSAFRVVSYRKTGGSTPIWNARGRNDYLSGKL